MLNNKCANSHNNWTHEKLVYGLCIGISYINFMCAAVAVCNRAQA